MPLRQPALKFATYKISKRFDQDISAVCAAFAIAAGGRHDPLAPGSRSAAWPRRRSARPRCEAALVGQPWNEATGERAAAALAHATSRRSATCARRLPTARGSRRTCCGSSSSRPRARSPGPRPGSTISAGCPHERPGTAARAGRRPRRRRRAGAPRQRAPARLGRGGVHRRHPRSARDAARRIRVVAAGPCPHQIAGPRRRARRAWCRRGPHRRGHSRREQRRADPARRPDPRRRRGAVPRPADLPRRGRDGRRGAPGGAARRRSSTRTCRPILTIEDALARAVVRAPHGHAAARRLGRRRSPRAAPAEGRLPHRRPGAVLPRGPGRPTPCRSEDGDVLVYSSTQHPSEVQHQVAHALGVGGAPGRRRVPAAWAADSAARRRRPSHPACAAALAARATGRPVKLRYDRDDDMHDHRQAPRLPRRVRGRLRRRRSDRRARPDARLALRLSRPTCRARSTTGRCCTPTTPTTCRRCGSCRTAARRTRSRTPPSAASAARRG